MLNVLLTGGTGFVGGHILERLQKSKCNITLLGRTKPATFSPECFFQTPLSDESSHAELFKSIDVVVHSAARAHIMKESIVDDPLQEYRKVNTHWTLELARQSAIAGVKRFIFISTVKVNGEDTKSDKPFTSDDNSIPIDPYGKSKYEAEQGLLAISQEFDMEVVIVRPPLVYGPYVKGNFSAIIKLVQRGIPLPLGGITKNKRSFIALENLVDFIFLCVDYKKSPLAANQIFLVSDNDDVSTAELLLRVAKAYGNKPKLYSMPSWLLKLFGTLLRKKSITDRLLNSLQVDSTKAEALLGWRPVISMQDQLQKMADIDSRQ